MTTQQRSSQSSEKPTTWRFSCRGVAQNHNSAGYIFGSLLLPPAAQKKGVRHASLSTGRCLHTQGKCNRNACKASTGEPWPRPGESPPRHPHIRKIQQKRMQSFNRRAMAAPKQIPVQASTYKGNATKRHAQLQQKGHGRA